MITSKKITRPLVWVLLFTALSTLFLACKKDDPIITPPLINPIPAKPNLVFYGINGANQLIRFNANNSDVAEATFNITGLQAGETITGIDFRPATGELYGVGSSSRIYVINRSSGAARAIGATAFTPAATSPNLGFDFNPTVDRIRLIGTDGQNLRLNPETGGVAATDVSINGAAGATIASVAYSGNTAGSSSTVLYAIDNTGSRLYRLAAPNGGTITAIGNLDVTVTGTGGFDISPDGTVALASLTVGGTSGLFRIDTTTGKATRLGGFASTATVITDIAIPTNPVAYAVDISNNLLILNPTTAGTVISKPITGVMAGENILGIDMRPANGQLYALGSTSQIYTINLSSGLATALGAPGSFTLSGTSFGFDFNPVPDRIRVVSNTGQNLRLDPNTGLLAATDGALNPGAPDVSAAAYTNNFFAAATTTLFVIDATTDNLVISNPPNAGTLTAVGPLGVNITGVNGFDIGSTSGTALGIFTVGATNGFYSISLTTGAATKLVDFPVATRGFSLGLGF